VARSPAVSAGTGLSSHDEKGGSDQIGTYSSHIQPVYRSADRCPRSLEVFNTALALPMYYDLKETEIDIAANALKESVDELK